MTDAVALIPVVGIPEVTEGSDLAELIATAASDLRDDDIIVVSSKVVSKAEGRVVQGISRPEAVRSETVRVVAARGETQIVQTRHGFVMAAAGVDNSNVDEGSLVLLPIDSDASARTLRAGLTELLAQRGQHCRVGVVVTDTFGRPWRLGQTDLAVGAAGVVVLDDHGGRVDAYGNELAVTAPALADELAGAADLVKGKLGGIPVAIVRGLGRLVTDDDGPGVRQVVRSAEDDMFRLGTRETLREAAGISRTVDDVADVAVDLFAVRQKIADALDSAASEYSSQWDFRVIEDVRERKPLLDLMGLPNHAPVVVEVRADRESSPQAFIELGAVCDRFLLSLVADRLAAVRARVLPEGVVAAYAIGAPRKTPTP